MRSSIEAASCIRVNLSLKCLPDDLHLFKRKYYFRESRTVFPLPGLPLHSQSDGGSAEENIYPVKCHAHFTGVCVEPAAAQLAERRRVCVGRWLIKIYTVIQKDQVKGIMSILSPSLNPSSQGREVNFPLTRAL
jgi:hypothetical protein